MFTLTKEEVEKLSTSSDPAIAAVAQKLKKAEEDGEFVPKSRMAELNQAKKEMEAQLKIVEDAKKKAAEDEARKNGELDKLLAAEKLARETAEATLAAEKKEADQYRAYRKSAVEEVKKQMGDKWLPEFETFSLESLAKLPGATLPKIGVETGQQSHESTFYTRAQIEGMSQQEVQANLKKVNESLAQLK
jgi:outer membrane translocation and assembly module TamA